MPINVINIRTHIVHRKLRTETHPWQPFTVCREFHGMEKNTWFEAHEQHEPLSCLICIGLLEPT